MHDTGRMEGLLRWHVRSVRLRAMAHEGKDLEEVRALLERATTDSWDGQWQLPARAAPDELDSAAADALDRGFRELFGELASNPLPDHARLAAIFDAVEFLPLELLRDGPETVQEYLTGYASTLPELEPMARRFEQRGRRAAAPRTGQ